MDFGLVKLGRVRYVGDTARKIVHDRWHKDSQGCALNEIVERGHAVGFEPDSLETALFADYEYCDACIDKTDPDPPSWARLSERPDEREGEEGAPLTDAVLDDQNEAARDDVTASLRERETTKAIG